MKLVAVPQKKKVENKGEMMMSICVAIAVPDGIALAADSQTTWSKKIIKAKEKDTGKEIELEEPLSVPISWSKMTRKLFKLTFGNNIFAACTSGAALLNSKTMYSVFKSQEANYNGKGNFDEVLEFLIDRLKEELKVELGIDDLTSTERAVNLNFILAGFDSKDVSKPRLSNCRVFSGTPKGPDGNTIKDGHFKKETEGFGASWIGRGEFVSHLVKHENKYLPPLQGQYALFSLSDAKDYARFLVEFTCDFQRFATMIPDCGRPIITAELTPDGYIEQID